MKLILVCFLLRYDTKQTGMLNKSLTVEVIEKPAPIVVTIDDDEIIVDGPVPAVHEESEETVEKPKVSCNKFKSGYINDSKKNETSLACTFSF